MTPPRVIFLIGDSDMARWPNDLYPTGTVLNLGRNGATLAATRRLLAQPSFEEAIKQREHKEEPKAATTLFFVVCVGENDLGSGVLSSHESLSLEKEMDELLRILLSSSPPAAAGPHAKRVTVLFLGPKLEPWLINDQTARQSYWRLSHLQEQTCRRYRNVRFVDCLTLFCTTETANAAGARLAGRAIPDPQYFDATDGLHLSRDGYAVWQRLVNDVAIDEFR